MACSCRSGAKAGPTTYTVVLPGGKTKAYSSAVAAEAEVKRVPGAYLAPKSGASV